MPSIRRVVFGSRDDRGRIPPVVYYFLAFLWRRTDDSRWHPVDVIVVNQHPLDYIARARAANQEREFCLMFFAQIDEDVYTRATT